MPYSTPGLLLGSLCGAEGRVLVLREPAFEFGVALQTSSRYASQTWCALRVSRFGPVWMTDCAIDGGAMDPAPGRNRDERPSVWEPASVEGEVLRGPRPQPVGCDHGQECCRDEVQGPGVGGMARVISIPVAYRCSTKRAGKMVLDAIKVRMQAATLSVRRSTWHMAWKLAAQRPPPRGVSHGRWPPGSTAPRYRDCRAAAWRFCLSCQISFASVRPHVYLPDLSIFYMTWL